MRGLIRDRAFLAGLVIRLALIIAVTPAAHLLTAGAVTAADGDALSPAATFGLPVLLLVTLGCGLAGTLGLALLVLAADLGVFLLLARTGSHERRQEVARLYWLSPLVVWALYATGTLAVFTALPLVAVFIAIEHRRYGTAGAAMGLAAACQPAVLVLLGPIALIFALSLSRLRAGAARMILAASAIILIMILLPAILSPAFLQYVVASAEMRGLIALNIAFDNQFGIAVLPLLLVAIAYLAWRTRVLDRELLWTFAALLLLMAIGAGDASPGMALLCVLFLCIPAAYAERSGRALLTGLSTVLLIHLFLFHNGPAIAQVSAGDPVALFLPIEAQAWLRFAMATIVAAAVIIVWLQVFQRGVLRNAVYLSARRPLAIGIAGDSGVGKDTLSDAVAALFSDRAVAAISGDDYHNWDRNKPMWRALTHLNPKANDLAQFNRHITELVDRRWVRARHYDHVTGRMTKPLLVEPGEIVLASGLHALSSPAVNALYDLRIFLDMDEGLRRHFKIRRDVNVRGHPLQRVVASLERRHEDALRFIHPQKADAHLVFRLEPRRPELLVPGETPTVPMRLVVEAVPGIIFERVVRMLVAIGGIQAIELPQPSGSSRLIVEGEPSRGDIAAAARRLVPGMRELLHDQPGWEEGLSGVMQLIALDQLEQIRVRRSVNA